MPKLHLKRTPEEEAAHRLGKKRRKEERNRKKYDHFVHNDDTLPPWASSHDADHTPDASSYKQKYGDGDSADLLTELEESAFREKMFAAYEDEERLDSIGANFNDFVHIPRRWKNNDCKQAGNAANPYDLEVDDFLKMDPRQMDDDEYAEWVRLGMHRKTHPDLYAEQQRKKLAKAQRKEEQKARRSETKRLEELAEEVRQQKKIEREAHQRRYARHEYELRWKVLMSERATEDSSRPLQFNDVPWPILSAYSRGPRERHTKLDQIIAVEDLTPEAILDFLMPPKTNPSEGDAFKQRKDKLRETFLRFHPDKFEGRFMESIVHSERSAVREAISQVVRSLNALTKEQN